MRRSLTLLLTGAVLVPALSPAEVRAPAADSDSPPPGMRIGAAPEQFLGFEVGEELRYVLGPAGSLGRGERGLWSIRLEEVYGAEDGPEGSFALRHEWQGPQSVGDLPLRTITRLTSSGTLRVNRHGFPLFIQHETVRHLAGYGDEAYTVDYQLVDDNERYEKRTTMDGERWYRSVPVRGHDTVDRDVPIGVFAFLPAGPGCLGRFFPTYELPGGAAPQPLSAAAQPSGPPATVKVADNTDCEESLFANPGLLNLAMPALWEAQGDREYVFFTPIGAVGEPVSGLAVGGPVGGGMPMGTQPGRIPFPNAMPNSAPRVGGAPLSPLTYFQVEALRFVERVSVRVGTRSPEAWLIALSDELGPVYVDDDGVVLRVDLPAAEGGGVRYLRRLWPSEF